MAGWINNDGLYVKFGLDEAEVIKGGHRRLDNNRHVLEFDVNWSDLLSATSAVIGANRTDTDGPFGITMPKGARLEEVETVVTTAFTSSGTIGSATLELGLKKASDRSTDNDSDGILTTAATGTVLGLATVGTKTVIRVGSTGAGTSLGVTLSENTVVSGRNSQHGSHPFTAGTLKVRVYYFFP